MKRNCENCRWCATEENDDMVCVNSDSEYVADFVDENHYCEEFEEKEE